MERDIRPVIRGDDVLPVERPHGFDSAQLERQLHTFLGPRSVGEDMRAAVFAFANVTAQLTGGEPLSPDVVFNAATETYLFGLPNAAASYCRSFATSPVVNPGCYGLVAMAGYATESVFDLLTEELLDSGCDTLGVEN